nr:MAG TPA: hypothetical protein [Caudoviricetes sp.]
MAAVSACWLLSCMRITTDAISIMGSGTSETLCAAAWLWAWAWG